jgi:O-antigen/teichoic acid export membrane protein
MMRIIKKLLNNPLLSGVFVVTVGSFVGSIFSYLLQVFLGRLLSLEDYGIFNTLLSFSVVLGVLGGAFSNSVIKKVSALKVACRFDTLTHLFWSLSFYCLLFGFLFGGFLIVLRSNFADFFNISDTQTLVSFSFLMGLTFLGSLPKAYLQGLLRFKALAFFTIFAAIVRFAFPIVAVYKGFRVDGVFGGMVLGTLLSYVISIFLLGKNFEKCDRSEGLNSHYKTIINFVGPLIFIQVGLTLLNNMDVILVKRLFDAQSAGIYAGVVTVGKIFLFGAGSVSTIMFPQVAEAFSRGEDPKKTMKKFLPLQAFLVAAGALIFVLFPKFITTLMFGERFLPAVQYVPLFTIFIGAYILVNFFILYFMAIEKFEVTYILGLGAILQAGLIWKFASTISAVISINVLITLIVLFLLLGFYVRKKGILR